MSEPNEALIYDRTQSDVTNATIKGQWNASDMNRVEEWCKYLADELVLAGYDISITTKTNWIQSDMREASEMERIRKNIKAIMNGYYYLTNIEANAEFFNFAKANNWERILNEINTLMDGMKKYYVHSGVTTSGQKRLFQNRFRRY